MISTFSLREIADTPRQVSTPPAVDMMSKIPKFRRWLFQNAVGWALASPLVFLVVPHLLLGISLRSLLVFWLDETIVFMAASAVLYWPAKRAPAKKDSKALGITVGVVLVAFLLVTWHRAVTLGIITAEKARGLAITSLVTLPLFIIGGYFFGPKVAQLSSRFCGDGKEGPVSKR